MKIQIRTCSGAVQVVEWENFTKLGDSIYFKKGNELFVNQYIASKVTWKEAGMNIEQISNVTTSDEAKFNITLT